MAEEITPQQQADLALAQKVAQPNDDGPRDIRELIELHEAPVLPKPDVDKPEKSEKKKLTKEEIAQATDALGQRLGFRPDKKKEEKTEEKKSDEKTEPTEEEKAAAAATEKPKKVKVTKKEPLTDPSDLAALTAAKTARAVAEELRAAAPKAEKAPDPLAATESTLLPDEQSELAVYKQMAADNPAYKDLPRQYLASIQKIEAYKSRWEKENPGEEFNPDDEAHDSFYKTNTPQFNARDFRKAEVRMEAKQLLQQKEEEDRPKRVEEQAESAKKEILPTIAQTKLDAAVSIVKTLGDGLLETIEKDGFDKFAEADPIIADAIKGSVAKLNNFLEAARQFDDPKGRIPYNPKDAGHVEYGNYLTAKEEEMSRKPIKQRYDEEGRLFLPRHEYIKIPADKRADYWYYDSDRLIELRVNEQAAEAKEFVDHEQKKLERIAKLRGWSTNGDSSGSRAAKTEKEEKPAKPAKDTTEIQSPEAGGGGKVDTSGGSAQKDSGNFFDRSAEILFRR